MIHLERLGHLALFVGNLERARDFYVQMLGCHVLEEESAEHGRTAFLEIGDHGNTLDLVEAAGAGDAGAAPGPGSAPGRLQPAASGSPHRVPALDSQKQAMPPSASAPD